MFNQKCWILFYSMNFLKKHYTPIIFDPINPYLKCLPHFIVPLSLGKQYFTNFKVGRLCWKRKESGKLLSATIYPLTMGKRAKCGKTKRVLLFFSKTYSWKEAGGDFFFHSEVYNHAKHSRRDESTWVTVKNGGKNTINVYMQCVTLSLQLLYLKKVPLLFFTFRENCIIPY